MIKSLEKLDPATPSKEQPPTEFKDPLRKDKSKKAATQILTPQDANGEELDSSINPIHPRQSQLLKDKTNETVVKLSEVDLQLIVTECVKKIVLEID